MSESLDGVGVPGLIGFLPEKEARFFCSASRGVTGIDFAIEIPCSSVILGFPVNGVNVGKLVENITLTGDRV